MADNPPSVVERMRAVFDLFEAAEKIKRQNLRRQHPDATEAEIEELFRAWFFGREELDEAQWPLRDLPDWAS